MKRANGSLTGGTGDVNPQYMHLTATQSAADTSTTTAFPIPIQRMPDGRTAQVMEILKIFYTVASPPVETDNNLSIFISTSSYGTTATNYAEPRVFGAYLRFIYITTSGMILNEQPYSQDLMDGAGHGYLVATDNLYVQINSAGTSLANVARIKILYRWKNVHLAEYIGIVQSQQ